MGVIRLNESVLEVRFDWRAFRFIEEMTGRPFHEVLMSGRITDFMHVILAGAKSAGKEMTMEELEELLGETPIEDVINQVMEVYVKSQAKKKKGGNS